MMQLNSRIGHMEAKGSVNLVCPDFADVWELWSRDGPDFEVSVRESLNAWLSLPSQSLPSESLPSESLRPALPAFPNS